MKSAALSNFRLRLVLLFALILVGQGIVVERGARAGILGVATSTVSAGLINYTQLSSVTIAGRGTVLASSLDGISIFGLDETHLTTGSVATVFSTVAKARRRACATQSLQSVSV